MTAATFFRDADGFPNAFSLGLRPHLVTHRCLWDAMILHRIRSPVKNRASVRGFGPVLVFCLSLYLSLDSRLR